MEALKRQAEVILQELGIPAPLAHELFYRQIIACHDLPFEPRIPNENTIAAMENARAGKGTRYGSVAEMFADAHE